MNTRELKDILERQELSPYQAEAYVTLLKLRDASASRIVKSCSVPQPRIYDVLRDLDEKGYIQTYEEDSLRARALDPTTLMRKLESQSEQLAATAAEIGELWEQPPVLEYTIESFQDFQHVISNTEKSIEAAELSVQMAISGSDFVKLKSSLKRAKERGVIINLSLFLNAGFSTNIDDLASYFKETASEARHRKSPAPFLALIDVNKAYFGLNRDLNSYGMFVKDQALTGMLYNYFFDSLWGRWEPVYADEESPFPRVYVDLRKCVTEIAPYTCSHEMVATVEGFETDTGLERSIRATVVGIIPDIDESKDIYAENRVSLVLELDGETITVGGFGAILEDIRATRIRIEFE